LEFSVGKINKIIDDMVSLSQVTLPWRILMTAD
jgi:hypothetical protein